MVAEVAQENPLAANRYCLTKHFTDRGEAAYYHHRSNAIRTHKKYSEEDLDAAAARKVFSEPA